MDKVYESKFQFLTDLTDEELDVIATKVCEIKARRARALWDDRINCVLSAITELIEDCDAEDEVAFTVNTGNYHEIEYTWDDVRKEIEEQWLS